MNGFCPSCEKETIVTPVKKIEEIIVRGEPIPVEMQYYKCEECGEEFIDMQSEDDPLAIAYTEYRNRKNMIQPGTIREFRKKYGLTQKELSELLGLGNATLSRYENGALQEEAHDMYLKLIMEPQILKKVIENKINVLSSEKREAILEKIEDETNSPFSWIDNFREISCKYRADIFSGYKQLDPNKAINTIKYLCDIKEIYDTELNRLLFVVDFKHFKDHSVSITGLRYLRSSYGPTPQCYELLLATMIDLEKSIKKEERWTQEFPSDVLISIKKPDLSMFSSTEIDVLHFVREKLESLPPIKIKELTLREKAIINTEREEIIPYSYADSFLDEVFS